MKMLVLGAGLQGCACAYDLLQNPAVSQVTLADLRPDNLPPFLARQGDWGGRLKTVRLDVTDPVAVQPALGEREPAVHTPVVQHDRRAVLLGTVEDQRLPEDRPPEQLLAADLVTVGGDVPLVPGECGGVRHGVGLPSLGRGDIVVTGFTGAQDGFRLTEARPAGTGARRPGCEA